jgi:L-lactate transport
VTDLSAQWQQTYFPVGGSLALSALVAALPIFVLLLLLGVLRKPAWIASLAGLATAMVVALGVYGMPAGTMVSASLYGAAFGLLPIGWIVFWAIALYRLTLETGQFEIIKDSIGGLTSDQRLQALLIAFAFGAFIEGAAGFGTPVAVAAGMLAGLGFSPFHAAVLCLLANTSPVAFGSIGTPLLTLQTITGLPMHALSSDVGRICAPVSIFIPAYLMLMMGGVKALRGVLPAAAVCGVSFATAQLLVSNSLGPALTDIIASLAAILSLIVLLRFWRPADHATAGIFTFGAGTATAATAGTGAIAATGAVAGAARPQHTRRQVLLAWAPYGLLVIFVLLWGVDSIKALLNHATISIPWPGLHNQILRLPPVVKKPSPYAAIYAFSYLSASGTACMLATIGAAVVLRVSPRRFVRLVGAVAWQLRFPMLTIATVLALAFLMNYSGEAATLGLAFAATGALFPFFSSLLGWLGVFLTGSDTSANALFGNLQVVTANHLGLNPVLMAASNSSGGVMGKMISLQSIAVAAAATGMPASEEGRLFRFTLKHSAFLAAIIGLIVLFYSYVMPGWAL